MSNKNDWLDTLHNCQEKLLLISNRLEHYSLSFYEVGNQKMYNFLFNESKKIEKIAEEIGKSASEAVTENLNRAKENSANVLKAALAGIAVATENKQDKQ